MFASGCARRRVAPVENLDGLLQRLQRLQRLHNAPDPWPKIRDGRHLRQTRTRAFPRSTLGATAAGGHPGLSTSDGPNGLSPIGRPPAKKVVVVVPGHQGSLAVLM